MELQKNAYLCLQFLKYRAGLHLLGLLPQSFLFQKSAY